MRNEAARLQARVESVRNARYAAKDKLRSVLVYGGFPLSARHVVNGILNSLGTPDTPELSTAGANMPTSEMDE